MPLSDRKELCRLPLRPAAASASLYILPALPSACRDRHPAPFLVPWRDSPNAASLRAWLLGEFAYERNQVRILADFVRMARECHDDPILGPAGIKEIGQGSLDHWLGGRLGAGFGGVTEFDPLGGIDVKSRAEPIHHL